MEEFDIGSIPHVLNIIDNVSLHLLCPNWTLESGIARLIDCLHPNKAELVEEETEREFQRLKGIYTFFQDYLLWVIVVLGVPGNAACLLTFVRMRKLGSCVVYVSVLAVVDSLALLDKLLIKLLRIQNTTFSTYACKTLFFTGNTLVIYANWIVVALAAERLYAVCRPLAVSVYWTKSHAAAGLGALLLLCLLVCTPVILLSTSSDDGFTCKSVTDRTDLLQAWHWTNVLLFGVLPCLLLLAFNSAIIIRLRKARAVHRQLRQVPQNRIRSRAEVQRQASVLLLVASFVLVILTIPHCVMLLMQHFWHSTDPVIIGRVRILKQVTFTLTDLNHAVNFYLYFISAALFRRRFLDMFHWTGRGVRSFADLSSRLHRVSESESPMCTFRLPPKGLGRDREVSEEVRLTSDTL